MIFFVTVTFDLSQAAPSIYPKVHKELENLDFSKVISGNKEIERKLPNNTFVAKFESDEFDKGSEITEFIAKEIKNIFKRHNVSGKYFIVVGKKWAWKTGDVH